MNKLAVKSVPFLGDELMAVRDEENSKIYVGVSYICKGIGFSKDQKDRQVKNIQNDLVINRGCVKFDAGVFDPNNETLGINIDFLPIWLAKITITPNMQKEQSEVADRLIQYQLKAKDVLAAAFIKPQKPVSALDLLDYTVKALKEQQQGLQATNERIDNIGDIISLDTNSWREDTRKLIVRIAQKMGGNEYIRDVQKEIYELVNSRGAVNLKIRLTNKRRRMADEGICKSKRDKLSKIDVIADDKKLIEIYTAIVKEMAVKYGVENKSA